MCVDEIDESEDENNEAFVEADDDSDTDIRPIAYHLSCTTAYSL